MCSSRSRSRRVCSATLSLQARSASSASNRDMPCSYSSTTVCQCVSATRRCFFSPSQKKELSLAAASLRPSCILSPNCAASALFNDPRVDSSVVLAASSRDKSSFVYVRFSRTRFAFVNAASKSTRACATADTAMQNTSSAGIGAASKCCAAASSANACGCCASPPVARAAAIVSADASSSLRLADARKAASVFLFAAATSASSPESTAPR
mmetsp:Transcript_21606/g.74344  ORF Transcript_21606/g.74344 Transcript_21606/m.74344 type:complete len:211 (-) Transcript_21606:508-1140(-)